MTNVQAKALKMCAFVLWTALWCWIYAASDGAPIQYLPGVEVDLWLICLGGWSLPWLPKGLVQPACSASPRSLTFKDNACTEQLSPGLQKPVPKT